MAERLLIKNFAGLDIDIELGRINLFIGPQASGKSVCAKCLYLFRSFVPDLLTSATQPQDKQTFEGAFLDRFREYFPNLWRSGAGFQLRYESEEAFVDITANAHSAAPSAILTYSPFLQEGAAELRSIIRKMRDVRKPKGVIPAPNQLSSSNDIFTQEYFATNKLRNLLRERSGTSSMGRQAFVIAGRAFLSTLKGSILTVLSSNPVADPLLREFLQLYETVRRFPPGKYRPIDAASGKLAESIIRGRLLVEDDEDYIELGDTRRIPLANASSGQQEAFSLLMILLDLVNPSYYPYSALYAEEPEAHLFPESQRALARLMARAYNNVPFPVQYVITTHSPYLLAVFNNLVYAHQVQQAVADDPAALRRLSRVVPKAERLPLADFRAYGLEDGKARSLINQDLGLLSADLLDSASDKINQQFGKLTDLDPSTRA
jgi:hypothetical protein